MPSLYFAAKNVSVSEMKMAENIINKIDLQDELPIILYLKFPKKLKLKGTSYLKICRWTFDKRKTWTFSQRPGFII